MFSLDSVRSCIHAPILRNWFLLLISPWKREVFSGSCITFVHAFYYELLRRAWETKLFYMLISSLPPSTRSTSHMCRKVVTQGFCFWYRRAKCGWMREKDFLSLLALRMCIHTNATLRLCCVAMKRWNSMHYSVELLLLCSDIISGSFFSCLVTNQFIRPFKFEFDLFEIDFMALSDTSSSHVTTWATAVANPRIENIVQL